MTVKAIRLWTIASRPRRTKYHLQTFRINAKKPDFTEFFDPERIPPSLLPITSDGNYNGPPRNNANLPIDNDDHRHNNHRHLLTFFFTGCIGGTITKLITDSVNQFNNVVSAAISQETPTVKGKLAIVIPMLNESSCITDLIIYLKTSLNPPPSVIICVDGGSTDDSVKLAKKAGARVIKANKKGRASQMNQGAVAASLRSSSDYFMFLHADSYPPRNSVKIVKNILSLKPDIVLGGFFTSIEHQGKQMKLLTLNNYLSTYYGPLLFRPAAFFKGLRLLFGDQTLFCRKYDFIRVGMFDDRLKLMEDADLCIRMNAMGSGGGKRGQGRVVQLPPHVGVNKTSGRRLSSWGNIKSTAIHLAFCLKYAFGASPEEIGRMYDRLYGDEYR
jgi:hypothetical protein